MSKLTEWERNALDCYLGNAKNAIFKQTLWAVQGGFDKVMFLEKLEAYITRIKNDPAQPKRRRVRVKSGRKYKTRKVQDA
jgi:hypothetical protein